MYELEIIREVSNEEKNGVLSVDIDGYDINNEYGSAPLEKQDNSLLKALINCAPVGMFIYDPMRKKIMYTNNTMADMISDCHDEDKGDLFTFIHPYEKTEVREKIGCILGGQSSSFKLEVQTRVNKNEYQWAELDICGVHVDGTLVLLGTIFDISNLMDAKKHIEEQHEELSHTDDLKSNFMHITNHELRTPIASIKGYSQMMKKGALGDISKEQEKALSVILSNVDRLDLLLQDVLDISDLKAHTMKFASSQVKVSDLLETVVKPLNSKETAVKIRIRIDEGIDEIEIDTEKIQTALTHLLKNAIGFSEKGDDVLIHVSKDEMGIHFNIVDHGPGIPEKELEHIFDTFYQVDYSMDRKYGGAGLGLAVTKGIVKAHGGHIWAESTVGKGSTFHVVLPEHMLLREADSEKRTDLMNIESEGFYYPQLSRSLL